MSSSPPLRRSPKRHALHERSLSHANEVLSPTVRVVGDTDAKVYASTPYPTRESHILSPPRRRLFEPDVSVSDEDQPTPATNPRSRTPDDIRTLGRAQSSSSPHYGSDSESSPLDTESPSSLDAKKPSQTSHFPSGLGVDRPDMDGGVAYVERPSEETIQLPSVWGRSDVRDSGLGTPPPIPKKSDHRPSLRAIASVASQLSIDSSASTETVIKSNVSGPPPRGSYALFALPASRPNSSRSTRSFSAPARPADIEVRRVSLSPVSSTSPTSPVSPLSPEQSSFPTAPRGLYSAPQYARSEAALNSEEPTLQYPEVRAPVVPGTRPAFMIPRRPIGGHVRTASERGITHLSTIFSESSGERNSGSDGRRDTRIDSVTSSVMVDRSSGTSYHYPMPPMPAFARSRNVTGSTIRVVNEEEEDLSDLPSPLRAGQDSSFYGSPIVARDVNGKSHFGLTRQGTGSRGSFLRDSIPAWARYFKRNRQQGTDVQRSANTDTTQRTYYANEGRNVLPTVESEPSTSRPQTHETQSSFPYGIFRTRSRPRDIASRSTNNDSMAITPAPASAPVPTLAPFNGNTDIVVNTETVIEVHGSPRKRTSPAWSPHLWHDRRSAINRRTIFIAPSLDEEAEGRALTRRNAQIWLFAVGFVFPLSRSRPLTND